MIMPFKSGLVKNTQRNMEMTEGWTIEKALKFYNNQMKKKIEENKIVKAGTPDEEWIKKYQHFGALAQDEEW